MSRALFLRSGLDSRLIIHKWTAQSIQGHQAREGGADQLQDETCLVSDSKTILPLLLDSHNMLHSILSCSLRSASSLVEPSRKWFLDHHFSAYCFCLKIAGLVCFSHMRSWAEGRAWWLTSPEVHASDKFNIGCYRSDGDFKSAVRGVWLSFF